MYFFKLHVHVMYYFIIISPVFKKEMRVGLPVKTLCPLYIDIGVSFKRLHAVLGEYNMNFLSIQLIYLSIQMIFF